MKRADVKERYDTGEWERLPKASQVKGQPGGRLRGLSRTTLLELHERKCIKIAAIHKPGAKKAIRLVFLPSLDAYLRSIAE
jgi:hypothetical protein